MFTAKQLTEKVALSRADRANYLGVSDHCAHAQRFTFPSKLQLIIGTLNVLNPAYVYYQSGIPPEGTEIPSWLNMETQAGLEHCPSSDPKRQVERENIIFASILEFVLQHPTVVLCLQECWPELDRKLRNSAETLGFTVLSEYDEWKSFRLMVMRGNFTVHGKQAVGIEDVVVYNVHLPFATEKTIAEVAACGQIPSHYDFVVGDFNVQTKPLSASLIEEGVCTETLTQFAEHFSCSTFALHPRGWTNWNVRKNCATPEENWDHFDNIMLISVYPVEVEAIDWNVTMPAL